MPKKEKDIYNALVAEGKCLEKIVYKEGIGYTKEPVCSTKDIQDRMRQDQESQQPMPTIPPMPQESQQEINNRRSKLLEDLKLSDEE